MKQYMVEGRLSGGTRLCDPLEAEDLEAVKKWVLEHLPEMRKHLPETHPGEELEEIKIYELVKVTTIDLRPKVTT